MPRTRRHRPLLGRCLCDFWSGWRAGGLRHNVAGCGTVVRRDCSRGVCGTTRYRSDFSLIHPRSTPIFGRISSTRPSVLDEAL